MRFHWPNPMAAGFKRQAAVSIKKQQGLNQEAWKVVTDPTTTEEQVKRSASSSESADVQPVDTQALKVSAVPDVSSEETGTTTSPPFFETTIIPFIDGRGDNMGYPSDYKKPVYYVDGNNIEKEPSFYKSYKSDKTEYDGVNVKVYKALQVQNVGLDQGMDASSGSEDTIPQEPKSASTSNASDASPSQESNEDSQSSEEATTGATTPDSNSSESSEETNGSNQPAALKSKNADITIA
ncbi:hypothetical protein Baya_7985 [Bagarius yarrelli]|uniref:Uncharacterized protein n=1 Tax=Bagarius yarrelli TaxID=175774 RepID=A0A556U2W4_BAGYA|nr:hypothetical protein Baya_7985 [Bagarius yarrelli]